MAISEGWNENGPAWIHSRALADAGADSGHQGQEQQQHAQHHGGVGVTLQPPMVAHEQQREHEERDRQHQPGELRLRIRAGQGGAVVLGAHLIGEVEPVDHHQADDVEQRDAGEDERVGEGARSRTPKWATINSAPRTPTATGSELVRWPSTTRSTVR